MTDQPAGVTERNDRDLWRRCRLWVEAQLAGEWGDDVINHDADKLYDFVMTERTATLAGRVVVPREPTQAMAMAYNKAHKAKHSPFSLPAYAAMIAAADDGGA